MIKLPQVTLVAVSSIKLDKTEEALIESQKGIEYGDILFINDKDIQSSDEYSRFMLYELCDYVNTDFALVVQHDGYVIRPRLWTDEFLKYDYIGAPWPPDTHFTEQGKEIRVGNGGFSFRSKKLLNAFNVLDLEFTDGGKGFYHEDGQICNYYREKLEKYGIKYAPVELAARFSHETDVPESIESFGFHKYR